METKVKRSVTPIYLVGVVWLTWGLMFSLHQLSHYITCTIVSLVVFLIARAISPDQVYQVPAAEPVQPPPAPKAEEKKSEPKSSGNPEIDALIKERDRALSEMRRLNDNIADVTISAQIDHLEEVTAKIINLVVEEPKKLPQIRRFLSYYLPTTLKILNAYDRMDSAGVSGDNITATKTKVETMMASITVAFDKQLDSLFGEDALDISTDISVMENLLAQEGLGKHTM